MKANIKKSAPQKGIINISPFKRRRGFEICLILLLFVLSLSFLGEATALKVECDLLPENISEHEVVTFTCSISDCPNGYNLSFITDLTNVGEKPLYEFLNLNEKVYKKSVEITPSGQETKVRISGKAPQVIDVKPCNGVVLKKYHSGNHKYYRVELRDPTGELIPGESDGRTFTVKIKELEEFEEKVEKIKWGKLKHLAKEMHNKGLVEDANKMTEYLIEISPIRGIFLYGILPMILIAFLTFVIGCRVGAKKGR